VKLATAQGTTGLASTTVTVSVIKCGTFRSLAQEGMWFIITPIGYKTLLVPSYIVMSLSFMGYLSSVLILLF
jgi:hypothetical protein